MPNRENQSVAAAPAEQGTPGPSPANVSETVSLRDGSSTHQQQASSSALGRIGRYQIVELIGGGGMGLVYKARDLVLERFVALKTIRSGFVASRSEIERFIKEAKAVAQFDHPNIVPIYEIGEERGEYFFTM